MPTLAETVEVYLNIERAPSTQANYASALRRLMAYFGDETEITALDESALVGYLKALRSYQTEAGKPLKSGSLIQYVRVIKSFFNWAVSVGHIPRSPAANLRIYQREEENPHTVRAVPPDELAAMLAIARRKPRNYALLLFLADTGCRVGALVRLRLEHLDLEQRTAWLYEKGARWHQVYYGPVTAEALRDWLKKRETLVQRRGDVDNPYVWLGQWPDSHLLVSAVWYVLDRLSNRIGAKRTWSAHSIRHAVGHSLAKAGVPITAIQRKLGHTSPRTTMQHYQPKDDAYLRQVSDEHSLIALGQHRPENPPEPQAPPEPETEEIIEEENSNIIQWDDWQQWRKQS